MYTLEREQFFAISLERAWDFLKDPANLNAITPEDLHFTIISPVPDTMFEGMIIEYRVAIPLFGTRRWVAEIKHIREKRSFVDEQRIGPYSFWYHYHELAETEQGIRVADRVCYAVPYGVIGRLLHAMFIRKTLDRIFDYRKERLAVIFG
ncbi:MAG: SRPBCC family protein [Desulfobulbaceae bacterium]|jgi:ligand-binding SRPBCC domain-containing protein|nr:SRPBCC family protein [Desulfobulbaceae bacterium]